jgi:glycosyltransferase involved in cell wall biosynthesis
MKILQVTPDSYLDYGGVSVHVRNISERLAKNHDVTVYATNHDELFPKSETQNGVKIERFRCYAPSNSYFFSWEMLLRMRKVEFDVVHAHGYHAFPLHLASFGKYRKFFITTHYHGAGHSVFRNGLFELFKPFGWQSLSRAERVIAVSDYEKRLICRKFNFNPYKVVVIPNGVDFSEFADLKRHDRAFRSILYVGYLSDYKGVQYLVEVLPKLADDIILEIVGSGPLQPYLEKRAKELGVNHRLKIYPHMSRAGVLQKFADADVFALLSRYEAYSLVVAESITAGTPCIVAETSALSEWVDNCTCFGVGFPIDLNSLVNKINYVLENNYLRQKIKSRSRKKILDWNEVVNCLERTYRRSLR